MGVFSEMAMDQFENNGDAPFQMDVDAGAPIDWNGQVDPPPKAVEPEPPRTPTTAKKESSDAVMKSSVDEDRKAHEEAEAKRKAEWEAQQAAKKAAEQKKILQIDNMSDEEVMLASAK